MNMTTKNKKLPTGHFTQMNFTRWRKERGIKLVISILPLSKGGLKRATSAFEGNTYVATGKTHSEALDNLFAILKEKANLDA